MDERSSTEGPEEGQVRTFVAIELPEEARSLLVRLQSRLRSGRNDAVKWVAPEGVHLTLHFLGGVPNHRLPAVEEALRRAVRGFRPFRLETGQPGAFPSLNRPRVIWVGVRGDLERLQALKTAVDEALRPLGFPSEDRPFSPHLTLGRVRPTASPVEARELGNTLRSVTWRESAVVPVRAVSLMRSDLTPRGAEYRALAVIELEG